MNVPLQFFEILVILGDKEITKKTVFDILEFEINRTANDKYDPH